MRSQTIALLTCLLAAPSPAASDGSAGVAAPSESGEAIQRTTSAKRAGRETIVGTWRHVDGVCTLADGAIQILPLGLRDHDMSCTFRSVSRADDVVTWRGTCEGFEDRRPEPVVVAATLRGRFLTIASNGRRWDGRLVRCSRGHLDGGR